MNNIRLMIIIKIVIDGAFSIDPRLEPIGVIGPICWTGSSNNLQSALKG